MSKVKMFVWWGALALILFGLVGCGDLFKQGYEQGKKAAQNPPAQTQDTQPAADIKNSSPAQTNSTESNRQNLIPGLEAADIKLNLEKTWKFKFTGPRPGQEIAQDSGKAIDADTGAVLICNIFEATPLQIQRIDFVIDASSAAGSASVSKINNITEGYFSYCATVPYEGAEPAKAKQWVTDNVRQATKAGNVLSTQIGPVKFEMFGTEYFRTLRIKPASQ